MVRQWEGQVRHKVLVFASSLILIAVALLKQSVSGKASRG